MGIDYRPDHSFRIPMPHLSKKMNTPNACDRCHAGRSWQWQTDAMEKWYGQQKNPHYGTILDAGRKRQPDALPDLVKLAEDRLYPTNVRATALSLASRYSDKKSEQLLLRSLIDDAPLMRFAAVQNLAQSEPREQHKHIIPLLYDPVKAVRIEAANYLASVSSSAIPTAERKRFTAVLEEYREAMNYTADFAGSRHNLGLLDSALGNHHQAIEHYQKALAIDREFYPAKVNLAMLYNSLGQKDKAEQLLREVVAQHPGLHEIAYSLGLLLVELGKYDAAVVHLKNAAEAIPQQGRIHYNLGLLLEHLSRFSEAEKALMQAGASDPDNMDYLSALAQFYLKTGKPEKARPLAQQMLAVSPDQRIGHDLLGIIEAMIGQKPDN